MFKYIGCYLDDDITLNRTCDVFMPEKVTQKTALFLFTAAAGPMEQKWITT